MRVTGFIVLFLLVAGCGNAKQDEYAQPLNLSFQCEESLPEFTLGPYSNPSNDEIKRLCSCIWNQFPENGWERRVSEKLANREDPGSQLAEFPNRFGNAIEQCGGDNL